MDLETKLNEFKNNVNDSAKKEYSQIEAEIQQEVDDGIELEIKEYEEKKRTAYEKNIKKMEKDFNKNIFNYEMNLKKEIIEEEKRLKENLKNDAINQLKEYTKHEEYKNFLINTIKEGLNYINSNSITNIGLTKKDIELSIGEIPDNVKVFEISDKYIGGCILENKELGIYIDNTLLNSINERLKILEF